MRNICFISGGRNYERNTTEGFALVEPNPSHKERYLEMMEEWTAYGGRLNPCALFSNGKPYETWLKWMSDDKYEETCPTGCVPQTLYFMMDSCNNRILGAITIRNQLSQKLLQSGGNIGYGIRPSERRKGYAAKMLALALQKCRKMGFEKVLVTCAKGNIGSAKTILKNGGILENEIIEDDSKVIQRYWIDLKTTIKPINESDLPACLKVIRRSFATIADEFSLTEQNCSTNGAFMEMERLKSDFDNGNLMYGYVEDGKMVGFMQLTKISEDTYELGKLAVLPEYRHHSYGKQLLEFACEKVKELGGKEMDIHIIEENTKLKEWYLQNGCIHTETRAFSHLPFTVGFMKREVGD